MASKPFTGRWAWSSGILGAIGSWSLAPIRCGRVVLSPRRHPWWHWTTQRRLLTVALVTLLPLTLATALLVEENTSGTKSSVLSQGRAVAIAMLANVNNFTNETAMQLATLAENEALKGQDPYKATRLLREILPLLPNYVNIFAAYEDGQIFASAVPLSTDAVNIGDQQYFRQAVTTEDTAISSHQIGRMIGWPLVIIAVPIRDDAGRISSILAASLTLRELHSPVWEVNRSEDYVVTVVDSQGVVLLSSDDRYLAEGPTWNEVTPARSALQGLRGWAEYTDGYGEEWLAAYEPEERAGWGIVVSYPARLVVDRAQQTMLRNASYIGLALAVAAVLALLMIRGFVRPLRELTRRGSALAVGGLSTQGDDITDLSDAFDVVSRRLERGHEEERQRIARDLHDGIAQLVALANVFARECGRCVAEGGAVCHRCSANGESNPRKLRTINDLLVQAVSEIDEVMFNLYPAQLASGHLVEALKAFVIRFESTYGIACTLSLSGTSTEPPSDVAVDVFRIAQEAMHNMLKHARCTSVRMLVTLEPGAVSLLIEDDGLGFDCCKAEDGTSERRGLSGMRERARSLGGNLTISSAPGRGTSVKLRVPVEQQVEVSGARPSGQVALVS